MRNDDRSMTICELNEQIYEAELSQCVGVTGYHHWFFLEALADAFNYEFRAFAVDSGGERLGVAPLVFRRLGPVSMVNFTPVCPFGPVLRGEALRAGRMTELLERAPAGAAAPPDGRRPLGFPAGPRAEARGPDRSGICGRHLGELRAASH